MQSMEEIYKDHAKTVYKYLLSMTHSTDLAEELTQETFYQAIKSADRFDGSSKVSTWLCAIAKNQYMVWLRKHPPVENLEESEPFITPERDIAQDSVNRIELMRKLHLVPDPYKETLYLRIFGNLSFREIGEIMSKSENWARVTFYRGKEILRKEIEKDEK